MAEITSHEAELIAAAVTEAIKAEHASVEAEAKAATKGRKRRVIVRRLVLVALVLGASFAVHKTVESYHEEAMFQGLELSLAALIDALFGKAKE